MDTQALLDFQERGYCILDDLYSAQQLQDMEAFFEDFREHGGAVFDGGSHYEEIDFTERQLRAMHPHRYSQKVTDWLLEPKVMDSLEVFLGCDALAAQTMYYYKPPGAKGQGMHQDNFFLLSKPATCIAAWTPIDDSEVENGCLYVLPGSHKHSIYCPDSGESKRWMGYMDSHINPFPEEKGMPVPVEVKRGQTLIFGGNLVHGSGPNRHASRSRRTFIGHYVNELTESMSEFYHPILNRHGEVMSKVEVATGGGPCDEGWAGGVH